MRSIIVKFLTVIKYVLNGGKLFMAFFSSKESSVCLHVGGKGIQICVSFEERTVPDSIDNN